MPADTGLAFVLVQHLDPNQPSHMPGLLSKLTKMKVAAAEDGLAVNANSVYTIPPNKFLFIKQGRLHLTETINRDGLKMPIDFFFRSLAEDEGERAIAVLFSGGGSDGTLGIRWLATEFQKKLRRRPEAAASFSLWKTSHSCFVF